jgi:uncharacterized protein
MRVVLDSNIYISSLLTFGPPFQIILRWQAKDFELIAHAQLLDELKQVRERPKFKARIARHHLGALINDIRAKSIWLDRLPHTERSPDPNDNFLLAMAQAGDADVLVTGDKSGLLLLGTHGRTAILTARAFLDRLAAK